MQPSRSIAYTQTDVDRQKTGRKIWNLRNLKIETELLTPGKSITLLEVIIQVGGEDKIDLCIACIIKEI
jgi:hypothetical protein